MSIFSDFSEFLVDKQRPLSSKTAFVLFVILAVFLVDNILGFSYFYNTNNKIEQVQKLSSIIRDSTFDSTTRAFARDILSETVSRKNIMNEILSLFHGKSVDTTKQNNQNEYITPPKKGVATKNNFWFSATAAGFYFLLALIMIPAMFFSDKTSSFSQRLATGIAVGIVFALIGIFFVWILGFIPQIKTSTWFWNYLINSLIQVTLIGLLVRVGNKKK